MKKIMVVDTPWECPYRQWRECLHIKAKDREECKIAAMEAAGIRVSPSPARLGHTLVDLLKGK